LSWFGIDAEVGDHAADALGAGRARHPGAGLIAFPLASVARLVSIGEDVGDRAREPSGKITVLGRDQHHCLVEGHVRRAANAAGRRFQVAASSISQTRGEVFGRPRFRARVSVARTVRTAFATAARKEAVSATLATHRA
jgi:hypothetical protein